MPTLVGSRGGEVQWAVHCRTFAEIVGTNLRGSSRLGRVSSPRNGCNVSMQAGLQDSPVDASSPAPAAMTYMAASLISHAYADSTRLPRPTRRVPNRGPGIVRGLQPLICGERRGCCRASRGVVISWRLQTDPGDRARATRASAGPAACAIKTMKAGKRASRRMKIRIRAGRWPGTPLLLSLTLAKSSAAITISGWKRCPNS